MDLISPVMNFMRLKYDTPKDIKKSDLDSDVWLKKNLTILIDISHFHTEKIWDYKTTSGFGYSMPTQEAPINIRYWPLIKFLPS